MQLQSLNAAPRSRQEFAERFCSPGKPNARTLQLFAQEQRGLIHHPSRVLPLSLPSNPSGVVPTPCAARAWRPRAVCCRLAVWRMSGPISSAPFCVCSKKPDAPDGCLQASL